MERKRFIQWLYEKQKTSLWACILKGNKLHYLYLNKICRQLTNTEERILQSKLSSSPLLFPFFPITEELIEEHPSFLELDTTSISGFLFTGKVLFGRMFSIIVKSFWFAETCLELS